MNPELELPDWLTGTPNESSYTLVMYEEGGMSCQEIELTRREYLELKLALARLRGLNVDALTTDEIG